MNLLQNIAQGKAVLVALEAEEVLHFLGKINSLQFQAFPLLLQSENLSLKLINPLKPPHLLAIIKFSKQQSFAI